MSPWTARRWAALIEDRLSQISRRQSDGTRWFSVLRSEGGDELLIDLADPTGPNGQRSFQITIREV